MQKVKNEREDIRKVREVITRATGKPPRGWLGPGLTETWQTPDLLAEEGYDYVADWVLDDQPVWLKTRGKPILNVPVYAGMQRRRHDAYPASLGFGISRPRARSVRADLRGFGGNRRASWRFRFTPTSWACRTGSNICGAVFESIRAKRDVKFWTGAQIADWYRASGPKAP